MTRQRQIILEVIEASQEHLDADAIHDLVKVKDPRIGLATVYRTLALLKEMGLVQKHSLGEEHGHFEAVQGSPPHYHFTCLGCRRVIEFQAPLTEVIKDLAESENLLVTEVHLSVIGFCSACKEAGAGTIDAKQ